MLAATLVLTLAIPAAPADDSLGVGDPAPPLDIAHWVKGDEVGEFESGKVYVVEFWATWCGPCVMSMPHLSELQEHYADYGVTFIGVSDEPLQRVVEFLFRTHQADGLMQNDRIGYTLTTDPDESVKKDYFLAANQRGIPCAFIVGKDGAIDWIGHPMTIDEPLEAIVHDTWDRDAFKAEWDAKNASRERSQSLLDEIGVAASNDEWPRVLELLDEVVALNPSFARYKVSKFEVLAKELGDAKGAFAYARTVAFDHWDDAMMLNQLAWMTVDDADMPERDLDFAIRCAKRANDLTEDSDPAILDTLARCHYEMGELDEAVAVQRRAVENLGEHDDATIRETLKKYEAEAKSSASFGGFKADVPF